MEKFAAVLPNLRDPDGVDPSSIAMALFAKLKQERTFQLQFQQDDVFLFIRVLP